MADPCDLSLLSLSEMDLAAASASAAGARAPFSAPAAAPVAVEVSSDAKACWSERVEVESQECAEASTATGTSRSWLPRPFRSASKGDAAPPVAPLEETTEVSAFSAEQQGSCCPDSPNSSLTPIGIAGGSVARASLRSVEAVAPGAVPDSPVGGAATAATATRLAQGAAAEPGQPGIMPFSPKGAFGDGPSSPPALGADSDDEEGQLRDSGLQAAAPAAGGEAAAAAEGPETTPVCAFEMCPDSP
eukprot:TRINITY_DN14589_c0_g2_i1.p1 TRINITY_DN14589_c0_g2~~TRINITY_DN14589_c0_g2_i1.p1  ORF type:complete len:246 (-),score=47.01 TRINITY_DN14589_c0_g2_i1:136-873(-)